MRTGKHNAGTAVGFFYVNNVNLDMITLAKLLIGNLLKFRQGCLVMTDCKYSITCLGVDTLNNCSNKLTCFALELCQYLTLFCLTNTLTEIVLRILRYYSAKLLGVKLNVDKADL